MFFHPYTAEDLRNMAWELRDGSTLQVTRDDVQGQVSYCPQRKVYEYHWILWGIDRDPECGPTAYEKAEEIITEPTISGLMHEAARGGWPMV